MTVEEQVEELRGRVVILEGVIGSLLREEPEIDPLEARHLEFVAPRAKKFLEEREGEGE